MDMKQLSFLWPSAFVSEVDSYRGGQSRSGFIREAVEARMKQPRPKTQQKAAAASHSTAATWTASKDPDPIADIKRGFAENTYFCGVCGHEQIGRGVCPSHPAIDLEVKK